MNKQIVNSLNRYIFLSLLLIGIVSVLTTAFFWINNEYQRFDNDVIEMKQEYLASQKAMVKREAENAIDFIQYNRKRLKQRLRDRLKSKVLDAHRIAESIWNANKGKLSQTEIEQLVINALNSIRFSNGRGYYFGTQLNGIGRFNPNTPEFNGKDWKQFKDINGISTHQQFVDSISNEQGEGWVEYYFPNPLSKDKAPLLKISFIKHFKPFDWYIGTGEYYSVIEKDLQKEVIKYIEQIKFGEKGYIFVGQWDGTSLTYPAAGKNMLHVKDMNGVKIVQELIKVAKQDGGFVQYVIPSLNKITPHSKLSYAAGIKDWKWYIGAGVNLDKINEDLIAREKTLNQQIQQHILQSLISIGFILILIFIIVYYVSKRTSTNILVLNQFFEKAADKHIFIDPDSLSFKEFAGMADQVNLMLTERNQVMDQLIKAEQFTQDVIDSMPSLLLGMNQKGELIHWNKAALKFFDWNKNEIEGQLIKDLVPELSHYIQQAFQVIDQDNFQIEKITLNKQHEHYKFHLQFYSLQKAEKEMILRMDDVTERTRLREMIIHTEKMLSLGGLAAGMAHEINNPLAGIVQSIQVIQNRIKPEFKKNKDIADEIGLSLELLQQYLERRGIFNLMDGTLESGVRAARIVENMLSFSRKSESRFEPNLISELMDKTIDLVEKDHDIKGAYDFKKVRIHRHYQEGLPEVMCEVTKIQQVFLNLLKNAAHAMSKVQGDRESQLDIRVFQVDELLQIEVEDNGPGISQDDMKRVFEPFYTSKAPGEGTGLGLSISYFIVTENHEGNMFVESELGKGTKFVIQIPVIRRIND